MRVVCFMLGHAAYAAVSAWVAAITPTVREAQGIPEVRALLAAVPPG